MRSVRGGGELVDRCGRAVPAAPVVRVRVDRTPGGVPLLVDDLAVPLRRGADPHRAGLAVAARRAAHLGRPVRVELAGRWSAWPLVVHPDGAVDDARAPRATPVAGTGGAWDGVGRASRRRAPVLAEGEIRSLGLLTAYLTVPRTAADTDWWRIHQASQGRAATLRPDNVGTIRATLSLLTDVRGIEDLDRPAQVHVLRRTFADAGWEVPRILDALDDAPLYVDAVGQVRLPSWHRGRVVLLGDAAHCPSPITGMGTSLALVGAYVLAGELAGTADHEQALAAYETRMRPYVERAQQLPPGAPGLVHPRTRTGVRALRAAVGVAGSAPAKRLGSLLGAASFASPPAEAIDLPRYPVPVSA